MNTRAQQHPAVYNTSVPDADTMVRLHLSENPFGASPAAVAAATAALTRINRYPAPQREELVTALARHWDVAEDQVAVANGSDELVMATALSIGDLTRHGLVTAGTFPGYQQSLERVGRGSSVVALRGAMIVAEEFAARLAGSGIGYICNPHNPTGTALTREQFTTLVAGAEAAGTPLVFDEAYQEFAGEQLPQARDFLGAGAPLIALRTFSKAYGLAALRVGYAIGRADLIAELRRTLTILPFSVNRVAQAAALQALADQEFLATVRTAGELRRQWFCAELRRRGHNYLPSVTNFVAVRVTGAHSAQDALARRHGILVRDTGMFGFPDHLRISLGTEPEMLSLLDALDSLENSRGGRHS